MSNKGRIAALDGIRAVGMFLIVAGHLHLTGFSAGQEILGNYVFFFLSGFMAAKPYTRDGEEYFLSYKNIAAFYWKNFFKVFPMLILATTTYCLLDSSVSFFDNIFFIRPYGTVWFLAQLLLYWLVLPAIMIAIYGLKHFCRANDLIVAVLLMAIGLASKPGAFWVICTNSSTGGMGFFQVRYIMIGMAFGYLCKWDKMQKWSANRCVQFLMRIGIFCMLAAIFCYTDFVTFPFVGYENMIWISAILVTCAYFCSNSWCARILSAKPIALIGRESLGIMLFHLPLHQLLPFDGVVQFAAVLVGSLLIGVLINRILRPVQRMVSSIAHDMESEKGFDIVSVLVLALFAVYLAGMIAEQNDKEYTLGETVGFSGSLATGFKYAENRLGLIGMEGTPIKAGRIKLKFRVEQTTAYDLSAVIKWLGAPENTPIQVWVDGIKMADAFADQAGITRIAIPNDMVKDHVLQMELSFPDKIDVQIASIVLKEQTLYEYGTSLTFTTESPSANGYFEFGLGTPEELATWAKSAARMYMLLPEIPEKDLVLTLSWVAVDTTAQRMVVTCEGVEIFNQKLLYEQTAHITIPQGLLTGTELAVDFAFPDACPSSFAFTNMVIDEKKVYAIGDTLTFTSAQPTANAYFSYGLGAPEEATTWAKGAASVELLFANEIREDLVLTLEWGAVDTKAQRMVILCAEDELLNDVFLDEKTVEVIVPQEKIKNNKITLDFAFPDACPSSFAFTAMKIQYKSD